MDSKPILSVKWCEYVRFLHNMRFSMSLFIWYPLQKLYILWNFSMNISGTFLFVFFGKFNFHIYSAKAQMCIVFNLMQIIFVNRQAMFIVGVSVW